MPAREYARRPIHVAFACVALLALHAALAWAAVSSKSSTVDEPIHALAAWMAFHRGDFRPGPENPALWQYWIALPQGTSFIPRVDFPREVWDAGQRGVFPPGEWVRRTLYQTPGNDGESLVRRSRAMSLILSVALGLVIAWWAYKIGGGVAAVTACAFYALCPSFLAHGPLVKNDVAVACALTACVAAVWQSGRRLTFPAALAAILLAALAPNTKSSGLILAPIVVVLLIGRAFLSTSWPVLGRAVTTPTAKLVVTLTLCLSSAVAFFALTWASYGFRFLPTRDASDPSMAIDMRTLLEFDSGNAMPLPPGRQPTREEIAAWQPTLLPRAIMFANEHHLLPQAYIGGLLHTHMHGLLRQANLLGQTSDLGWWYYFPLAFLFKTPVSTLLAAAAAILIPLLARRPRDWWSLACLTLPPAIYVISAIANHLNIGIRHVLPIYPFLFIAIGLAAARLWPRGTAVRVIIVAFPLALAAESLWAYPDYIAFFNPVASAAGDHGMSLLADSNLDWGQDLPAVARWRREHPQGTLFLRYYGTVDPTFYHIDHIDPAAPRAPRFAQVVAASTPDHPVYVAVSATYLQGLGVSAGEQTFYEALRKRRPLVVLDRTIYLYHIPPPRRPSP